MAKTLTDLDRLGPTKQSDLESMGITSLEDLGEASVEEVAQVTSESRAREWIHEAKKNTVVIKTGEDVAQEYKNRTRIPSGLDELDEMIGGGWESTFVTIIYGRPSTGKTQVGFKSMVTAVEETGKPAVYIETERGRYGKTRLDELASNDDTQENIYKVEAYSLDQQQLSYSKIRESFSPDDLSLIVIDSFTAQFRLAEDLGKLQNLSDRSRKMQKHLTGITAMADELDVPVLLTGQIYETPEQYQSDVMYGGSLLEHTVNFKVHMKNAAGDSMGKAVLEGHPEFPEDEVLIDMSGQMESKRE